MPSFMLRAVAAAVAVMVAAARSVPIAHAQAPVFDLAWGTSGSGVGQFSLPHGIAASSAGVVYVGDTVNHRIQKFSSTGAFTAAWGPPGLFPAGVGLDASGNLFVADVGNDHVYKFEANGAPLAVWGSTGAGAGQLDGPNDVAVGPNGVVYV